jgi:hypothetical protein
VEKKMRGNFRSSAALVWRHQRLLWSVVALNLALAWLSSLPLRVMIGPILDRSMESTRLVTGFDVGTFILLQERPDAPMRSLSPSAMSALLIYLLAMVVLDGGVVVTYLDDRRLQLGEFCEYCGQFFWRMLRLAVYTIVPFALLAAAHSALADYGDKLSREAGPDRLGFEVKLAGTVLILLLALLIRLWFDLAQARLVRSDQPAVLRELLGSFIPALRSGLYWQYAAIAVLALATFAAGLAIWMYLPHPAIGASFVVLELVTIAQIGARLWMKSASARWVALQPEAANIKRFESALMPVMTEEKIDQPQPE